MPAAKQLVLNTGRQYPLTLEQAFTFENLSGIDPILIAKLPRNAVVLSGCLHVTAAFNIGSTIQLGITGQTSAYGTFDSATVGPKTLTTNLKEVSGGELYLKPSVAMTAGAGTLYVTYVLTGRANEVQP